MVRSESSYIHSVLDLERCVGDEHQDVHSVKGIIEGRGLVIVCSSQCSARLAQLGPFIRVARNQD